ncbi:hypothetical protein DENSPDRAFT_845214 [Dentipellis sp. KUC8613]|nr:hypothetical protein DENSPDRAFT_845200 [Dentipellis sp. KUC8613]KAA1478022.1 hypothetical protein DENSPDRAFT_845214 [Dentipellis sp. KUC8613]
MRSGPRRICRMLDCASFSLFCSQLGTDAGATGRHSTGRGGAANITPDVPPPVDSPPHAGTQAHLAQHCTSLSARGWHYCVLVAR